MRFNPNADVKRMFASSHPDLMNIRTFYKIPLMKKILFLLLLFSKICLGQTILEGKLTFSPNTSFSILTDQSALNDYVGVLIGQGKTDDSGQFSSTIDLKTEQPINLFIGNTFFVFWAKPNTTLNIKESSDKGYIFSGAMAKENNILYTSGLMQPYKVATNVGLDNFEPEKQLYYLDSLETKRLLILEEKNYNLTDKFISYYKTEVSAFSYLNKNQYPSLFKATNKITDKDIPKDYFKFWNNFTLQNDSTTSATYSNALQDFIEYKALERIGKSQIGTERAWIEMFRIADTFLRHYPMSLQKQKTAYLFLLIKYFNYHDFTSKEIDNYKKQFPTSASISLINDLWQKKEGSVSIVPSFCLKNDSGKWVDIKDLIGKVIYVDFWGSWCKACIINMPHAALLKEKFEDKEDVVFLYLNFYDTQQKWLTAIKKYNVAGVHLKAEKSDEEYFDKLFNISQGFPRYALIDKKGQLVTISAPPPNDQGAYDLIKKYLDEE